MIRIQNIYYMLAYAFHVLNEEGYKQAATEDFEYASDLFAAILSKGIASQIKKLMKYIRAEFSGRESDIIGIMPPIKCC